jgi:photosystem II stability/assembly factor-like uncharacterized protein
MRLTAAVMVVAGAVLGAQVATSPWTIESSGVTVTFRGVSAASDTIAWASGSRATVLHTTDAGQTWAPTPVPGVPPNVDFRDVDAVSPDAAYLLGIGNGELSRIYKTADDGAHWDAQFLNKDPKVFLDAMTFADPSHGVVIGDSIDAQFFIMKTDDGGKTWARIPPEALPGALPNEGAFAASGTNIAYLGSDIWIGTGASTISRVLHSGDRGKTWTIVNTPIPANDSSGIFSTAFRDAKHGVVVGGDYKKEKDAVDNLAITSDGGKTWTLVKDHGLSGFRSVVAYVPHAKTPTLIAIGPQGADVSTDDGRTWAPFGTEGFHTFSFAPSGAVGWGAGGRGKVGRLEIAAVPAFRGAEVPGFWF